MLVPAFGKGPVASAGTPPPPQYIKYLPQGEILAAQRSAESPLHRGRRSPSTAQRAGLRYQRHIEKWVVESRWRGRIDLSPWFSFTDRGGLHFCQPDLVLWGDGFRVVAEIKLHFHSDVWWQLNSLYLPVLRCEAPSVPLRTLCICRSFDPALPYAKEAHLVRTLSEVEPERLNVLVVR